ncbi:MAG: adenylate/guanylate cyclase domain-containing protein [Acidimicrobiia bacterium]|nr:adenylate/guanylate cyclase domain-containing protein [Acidimicrobiia bacterium]
MERSGFVDRLAHRLRPSGSLAALEEPRTIVWIAIIWTWGSALNTFVIAGIFFVYDELLSGWIAVGLAVVFLICWLVFYWTGSARLTFGLAIGASMLAVPAFQVVMGGYANSGAQPIWGIGVTVVAGLVLGARAVVGVGLYWVAVVVTFGFVEQGLQAGRTPPAPGLPAAFFSYNVVAHLVLLVPVVFYLLSRLSAERERSESLLLNVLPPTIAGRLKAGEGVIADQFDECSVLFADISGFTSHTRQVGPSQLIAELNRIFTTFDGLTEHRGAQKIKTVGDGYMVVAGVPEAQPDHLHAICDLALDMQAVMSDLGSELGVDLQVRIGVNSGPAVAGIIGTARFSYDLWGETVNLASRLESSGEPGRIQVSSEVVRKAGDRYHFSPAGRVDLKGIGQVETFWLEGRAN